MTDPYLSSSDDSGGFRPRYGNRRRPIVLSSNSKTEKETIEKLLKAEGDAPIPPPRSSSLRLDISDKLEKVEIETIADLLQNGQSYSLPLKNDDDNQKITKTFSSLPNVRTPFPASESPLCPPKTFKEIENHENFVSPKAVSVFASSGTVTQSYQSKNGKISQEFSSSLNNALSQNEIKNDDAHSSTTTFLKFKKVVIPGMLKRDKKPKAHSMLYPASKSRIFQLGKGRRFLTKKLDKNARRPDSAEKKLSDDKVIDFCKLTK